MTIVWATAILSILIALPGPLFRDSLSCTGPGTILNLPQYKAVRAHTFLMSVSQDDGVVSGTMLGMASRRNLPSPGFCAWRPRVDHLGYPVSMWTVITPHFDVGSTQSVSNEERQQLRNLMADLILQMDSSLDEHAKWVRSTTMPMVRHHWRGYAINPPFWMALLLLFISSMRALRWVSSAFTLPTKRDLLARGLCPTCRYDLRGLPSNVCPECGTAFDGAALPA